MKIDEINKKLLFALEMDATVSYKALAKICYSSPEKIRYRIKQLENEKVIQGFRYIYNRDFFGIEDIHILISTKNCSSQDMQSMEKYLIQHPNSKFVVQTLGNFEYYVVLAVHSFKESAEFMYGLEQKFPEKLSCIEMFPEYTFLDWKPKITAKNTSVHPFTKKKNTHTNYTFDTNDKKILIAMKDDCRKSAQTIAKETNLNIKTILEHKKKFVQKGIIAATFCNIDAEKIGFEEYIILYKLRLVTKEEIGKITQAIKKEPSITYASMTAGPWHIRISSIEKSNKELKSTLERLESNTSNVYQRSILQVTKTCKRTSTPDCIFDRI